MIDTKIDRETGTTTVRVEVDFCLNEAALKRAAEDLRRMVNAKRSPGLRGPAEWYFSPASPLLPSPSSQRPRAPHADGRGGEQVSAWKGYWTILAEQYAIVSRDLRITALWAAYERGWW